MALLNTTLPVLLRRAGASLEEIGWLSLAFLPWAFKFAWAPLVDRFGSERFGRYRSWVITLLPSVAALVCALGAADVSDVIARDRALGIGFLVLLTTLCATVDTAAHGLAVVVLESHERGDGNAALNAGQMAGNLLGGGVAVVGVGLWGWSATCYGVAALYAIPFLLAARASEPDSLARLPRARLADFAAIGRGWEMRRWLVWLAGFGLGYGLFGVPYQGALVDAGLDLTQIGLVYGVCSSAAGIGGAGAAGAWMRGRPRERAFRAAGAVFALSLAPGLATFASGAPAPSALVACIAAAHFGVAFSTTTLYAMMMDRARGSTAGTDFTAQYSVLQIAGFASWGAGGVLAERWTSVAPIALAIGVVPLLWLASWRLRFGDARR
ncbi:MAG: MFS transporter [Deltaproteobacteria bacterium]|nr:MFS transporter [Deltaproteobacteria bacterium]